MTRFFDHELRYTAHCGTADVDALKRADDRDRHRRRLDPLC